MSTNLYLVFSRRPGDIGDERYQAWYAEHAQENIESPGFVSAQRYRVREVVDGQPTGDERHLAVYEYDGPMSTWRTDLTARIERGAITLPDWFPQISFTSWACEPTGDLMRPQREVPR
jgi:hypothetical protein